MVGPYRYAAGVVRDRGATDPGGFYGVRRGPAGLLARSPDVHHDIGRRTLMAGTARGRTAADPRHGAVDPWETGTDRPTIDGMDVKNSDERRRTPMTGVAALPRGWLARARLRLHVRLLAPGLDERLADGEDPWSSPELAERAGQITAWEYRKTVADAVEALVETAEGSRRAPPAVRLRAMAILEQREALRALAQRLRRPEPVDVGVVARLSLLVRDPGSPAFAGGRPVESLRETVELCAPALVE